MTARDGWSAEVRHHATGRVVDIVTMSDSPTAEEIDTALRSARRSARDRSGWDLQVWSVVLVDEQGRPRLDTLWKGGRRFARHLVGDDRPRPAGPARVVRA